MCIRFRGCASCADETVTAIALALGASLAWGLGDFLGGIKSRVLSVLTVLAISQQGSRAC